MIQNSIVCSARRMTMLNGSSGYSESNTCRRSDNAHSQITVLLHERAILSSDQWIFVLKGDSCFLVAKNPVQELWG